MKYLLRFFFLLLAPLCWAQLVMEYYNDSDSLEITQKEIFEGTIHSGLIMLPGDIISTGNSHAEFSAPDTSIFLLNTGTHLEVDSADNTTSTTLIMPSGKIRLVIAKDALPYHIVTSNMRVEASYGEVFIESSPETGTTITVYSGSAQIIKPDGTVKEVLPKMQYKNASLTAPPTSMLLQEFRSFPFRWLDPRNVRGYVDPFTIQQQITTAQTQDIAEKENAEEKTRPEDKVFRFQASAGTLINGEHTYGNFLLAPTIVSDNFTLALHFPLTFRGDLTDLRNFYYPVGNFEWSFGSDYNWKTNTLDATFDVINDTLLKIGNLRVFTPQSRFYLQIGHITQISMGNLVRSFDNTPSFPYRRRSGIYTRLNLGVVDIQAFAEEVTPRGLYGLRMEISPSVRKKGLQIGALLLLDMGLSRDGSNLSLTQKGIKLPQDEVKDRWGYIVSGLDLRIPFIIPNQSTLNIIIDVNGLFFIERNPFKFYYGTFWHPTYKTLPGLGASVGLGGRNEDNRPLHFRYTLALQYQSSLVPPIYVTSDYEYMRLLLLDRLITYISEPENSRYGTYTVAFNADLGFKVGDWLDFQAFYSLPFSIFGANFKVGENDFLFTSIVLGKDEWLINFRAYLQINQLTALFSGKEEFLSIKNRVGGSVTIQIQKILELSFSGSTIILEDEGGNFLFNNGFNLGASLSILATLKL